MSSPGAILRLFPAIFPAFKMRVASSTLLREKIMSVRISPRRLVHANLIVSDLEQSMHFYNQVCGLEEVRREEEIAAGFLTNGNTHHDIAVVQSTSKALVGINDYVQMAEGSALKPGLNHLGWEMDSEAALIEAWHRAQGAGVEIDGMMDHQLSRSMYIYDPDGNHHEFYADTVSDWRTIFSPDRKDLITSRWDPEIGAPDNNSYWARDPEVRKVSTAAFHPRRTSGAVLITKNFSEMRSFFIDAVGMTPIVDVPNDYVLLRSEALHTTWDLALFAPRSQLVTGLHHVIFEITDEGELIDGERKVNALGSTIELIIDRPHKRSVFVRDPDGMLVEFRHSRAGVSETHDAPVPGLEVYLL